MLGRGEVSNIVIFDQCHGQVAAYEGIHSTYQSTSCNDKPEALRFWMELEFRNVGF